MTVLFRFKYEMNLVNVFICFFCIKNGMTVRHRQQGRAYDNLMDDLFDNYDLNRRPVRDVNRSIQITISPQLYHLVRVDEPNQLLKLQVWESLVWNDEFLMWNPKHYDGNITYVKVPATKLWIPDIMIGELIAWTDAIPREHIIVRVEHFGNVTLNQLRVVSVLCSFKIIHFPFDVQNCSLYYGSWSYEAHEMTTVYHPHVDPLMYYQEDQEWDVISFRPSAHVLNWVSIGDSSNTTWLTSTVFYHLVFKRIATFYMYVMVLPSFLIVNICLIGMFTPFSSTGERLEKITTGSSAFLTLSVVLNIVSTEMPKSEEGLPWLGTFILDEMMVISIGVAVSVIIMVLHERALANSWQAPRWLLLATCMRAALNNRSRQRSHLKQARHEEEVASLLSAAVATDAMGIIGIGGRNRRDSSRFGQTAARARTHSTSQQQHGSLSVTQTGILNGSQNISPSPTPSITANADIKLGVIEVLRKLDSLKVQMMEKNSEINYVNEWNKIFSRIDWFMLVVFMSLNVIISIHKLPVSVF